MKHSYATAPLFRFVYTSRVVFFVVVLLSISILLQPFRLALAATDEASRPTETHNVLPDIPVASLMEMPVGDALRASDEASGLGPPGAGVLTLEQGTQALATTSSDAPTITREGDSTTVSTDISNDTGSTSNTGLRGGDAQPGETFDVPPGDLTASDGGAASSSTSESVAEGTGRSPFLGNPEQETPTTTATTTATPTASVEAELPLVVNSYNDNELRFDKEQCTPIADGSFYCQPKPSTDVATNGLVAAPDADGDLEIFLVTNGNYTQITHNLVDDAAPYFDAVSNTIVWHRLVGDQYQIFSFVLDTGMETLFASSQSHNMEPARQGKYTVWQRWVNEHWQVMLSDGESEVQVSKTSGHNLAPYIRGQFIIWNTKNAAGDQQIETFDLLTRSYLTIGDGDEATMMNPRMMMVYEAVYKNGDIVTRGFDILTGKVTPISALPRELPTDIPNSDSTGETRALISSKSSGKDVEVETEPEPTPTSTPPLLPGPVSDVGTTTLDLRAVATSTSPAAPMSGIPPNPQFDLVIATTSTQITPDNRL